MAKKKKTKKQKNTKYFIKKELSYGLDVIGINIL